MKLHLCYCTLHRPPALSLCFTAGMAINGSSSFAWAEDAPDEWNQDRDPPAACRVKRWCPNTRSKQKKTDSSSITHAAISGPPLRTLAMTLANRARRVT